MRKIALVSFVVILSIGIVSNGSTAPVTVTYTADNFVMRWYLYQDGFLLASGSSYYLACPDNWLESKALTLDLGPGHIYQFIWQTRDVGLCGGFLAEISCTEPLITNSLLSSTDWEVALVDSLEPPPDFGLLDWMSATEWGANDDPNTIWHNVKGGPIEGIAGGAQWIWTEANCEEEGAPGGNDSVFVRATIETLPVVSADLDIEKFKIANVKRANKTITHMVATTGLPELGLEDGDTVESKITIELFDVLAEGGDLILSGEATLTVKDRPNLLVIGK